MIAGWPRYAACAGAPPQLFDAPRRTVPTAEDRRAADTVIIRYCNRCPVRQDCLDDAIATRATGVRGGLLLTREHGSITAYNNHKKAGEEACPECLEAAAAYTRDRRDPIPAGPDSSDEWMLANGYLQAVPG